jgi:hypothetical protein
VHRTSRRGRGHEHPSQRRGARARLRPSSPRIVSSRASSARISRDLGRFTRTASRRARSPRSRECAFPNVSGFI